MSVANVWDEGKTAYTQAMRTPQMPMRVRTAGGREKPYPLMAPDKIYMRILINWVYTT